MLMAVRARPPEISRNIPAHLSCYVELLASEIAGAVVAELGEDADAGEDEEDDAPPARGEGPSELRRELKRKLKGFVTGMVDDFFGG